MLKKKKEQQYISFYCCSNQWPQTQQLKIIQIYYVTVLSSKIRGGKCVQFFLSRSHKAKILSGGFESEKDRGGNPFPHLFLFSGWWQNSSPYGCGAEVSISALAVSQQSLLPTSSLLLSSKCAPSNRLWSLSHPLFLSAFSFCHISSEYSFQLSCGKKTSALQCSCDYIGPIIQHYLC